MAVRGSERAGEALWGSAVEAILARGEAYEELDPWLERLEGEGVDRHLGGAADGRALVAWVSALLLRRPGAVALARLAAEGYRHLLSPLQPEVRLRLGGALLLHGLLGGGSGRIALVTGALWGGVRLEETPAARVVAQLGEAIHSWGRGRSRAALAAVHAGLAVADAAAELATWGRWLRCVGVAVALGRGEVALADRWLRDGLHDRSTATDLDLALYHILLAWRGVAAGEAGTTLEATEVAEALAAKVGVEWLVWAARLLRAEALGLRGEVAEGRRLVAGVRPLVQRLRGPLVTVSTAFTEAHLAAAAGDETSHRTALTRGLVEARDHGQRLWLGQRRPVAARLMAAALRDGIEGEEARGWVQGWELLVPPPPLRVEAWPWPVRVETLGRFRVVRDGVAVGLDSSAQRRPLDLLRALLACGGRGVRRERLADLLWPEADGDAAQRVFATTLHRLGRLVGRDAIVRSRDGRVGLDPARCWVDAWVVEERLAPLLACARSNDGDERQRVEQAEAAIDLYRGPLLRATGGEVWLLAPRERLHGRVIRAVARVGGYWEQEGEIERAITTYERGLEVDGLEEPFYQGVIRGWLALGLRSKAMVAYRRCEVALAGGLGVEPSAETTALLRDSTPLSRRRVTLPRLRR